jgi:hypothetical protein
MMASFSAQTEEGGIRAYNQSVGSQGTQKAAQEGQGASDALYIQLV